MLRQLLGKLWNRRKEQDRFTLELSVKSVDSDGIEHELRSEDLSESGVRLWFKQANLGSFIGHREEVPLEILLDQNGDSFHARAQLVWACDTANGGTLSGWQFRHFEDDGLSKLRSLLDANQPA
jgi:hypothetical protein